MHCTFPIFVHCSELSKSAPSPLNSAIGLLHRAAPWSNRGTQTPKPRGDLTFRVACLLVQMSRDGAVRFGEQLRKHLNPSAHGELRNG